MAKAKSKKKECRMCATNMELAEQGHTRAYNLAQENKGLRNALYDRKVERRTLDAVIVMLATKVKK